jgi:hypothetical protein
VALSVKAGACLREAKAARDRATPHAVLQSAVCTAVVGFALTAVSAPDVAVRALFALLSYGLVTFIAVCMLGFIVCPFLVILRASRGRRRTESEVSGDL